MVHPEWTELYWRRAVLRYDERDYAQAEELLAAASQRNPGPWVDHSRYVAGAAAIIATHHPNLDPETATILGLL